MTQENTTGRINAVFFFDESITYQSGANYIGAEWY
jgi:hypothetical protein